MLVGWKVRIPLATRQSADVHPAGTGILRLSLLGPVEVRLGAHRLDITAPQTLAMLVILAAEPGRTLSTAQMAARLWADRPPSSAVNVLRNHVHGLRRQFDLQGRAGDGAEWLGSGLGGYRLGLPVETDVARVEGLIAAAESDRATGAADLANEKLVAAQHLWRGDPLVGLPGPWMEKERARLEGLRSALSEAAIAVTLDLGRYSAAVADLEARIAAEPHCERWYELLMVALYRAGRRVEALEVYRNARRLLADEHGLEPGPRIARLHQEILSAEPSVAARELPSPESGFIAPRVPAQLPPDITDFVGRDELVQDLAGVLGTHSGNRPAVAITGMGGVGKTTLAVHLAHRVRRCYPDGALYLDLGGMDEHPRSADMLVEIALRAFGLEPSELPLDQAERAGLWRNMVASKRVLLVLDNAHDADHVAPLLPGAGAAGVLVTSRSSLVELFDARLVPLDVLTPDEGRMLLERMVSARRLSDEPDAAREILRRCGDLPLSLRIVGARLASRPHWMLASVAERLTDDRERLAELAVGDTSLESVFQSSYRRLDPELSRAFVLIALSDAPDLSTGAIAALLDRSGVEAERLCETLADLSMVQTSERGRYRLHDLVRLFARRAADPAQRREWPQALHRLVDFYLASAKNIMEIRDPEVGSDYCAVTGSAGQLFTDERQCTAWVTTEGFGLLALYWQVADHGDAQTYALAADLALLLAVGGDAGQHQLQLAPALEALGRAAEAAGDRRAMARVQLASAGIRLNVTGNMSVEREFGQVGAMLLELGDRTAAAMAEVFLGTTMSYQGNTDAAVTHLRRAIELIGRQWGGIMWAKIARACCDAGRWEEAVEVAEQALAVAREGRSLRTESMALHELGFATLHRGDAVMARKLCEQAVEVARQDGRLYQEGWALYRLAQVLLCDGDAEAAVPLAAEAVQALTEASGTVQRLLALRVYGCALDAAGHVDQAEPILAKVEQSSRRLGISTPHVPQLG
jgi:DNA-binding SARP family transcriptional activator